MIEPTWAAVADKPATLSAKITLMCGCPIEPGGHWDAGEYEVLATLSRGGKTVATLPLVYAGTPSMFAATASSLPAGRYRLLLTAHNASTGNTGVVGRDVEVK